MTLQPVILCGGAGTRLWPLSRERHPKQFLPLTGSQSLLQLTLARLQGLNAQPPLLICNEEQRFIAAAQLQEAGQPAAAILLEPVGRNTAPAIALAAHYARQQGDDPLLLVLPADHAIADIEAFQRAVQQAIPLANDGQLVTFGIEPDRAETGYGYIRTRGDASQPAVIEQFVEKPDAATAAEYLASGDYLWNSGMFLFRASVFWEELDRFRPDIAHACLQAAQRFAPDLDFLRVDVEAFRQCPAESIDYAVMEETQRAMVVPLRAAWSDLGSWASLWEVGTKDAQGNVCRADTLLDEVRNSYFYSEERLIAAIGIDDLVVVDTADALLLAPRARVQEVKHLVERLRQSQHELADHHRKVYRPWGWYDALDDGERFQVKRILVKPGAKLSVQMHHHRAEHWIVVSGTAQVTIGDQQQLVTENQSVYIPLGVVHALENPGKLPLELIEVQSGAYLGEDDIVRFEDRYGRS